VTRKNQSVHPRAKVGRLEGLAELWRRFRGHHNAAEAVYMTLREAILHGVLTAGQQLNEVRLAAIFGRSRTPVREAILRLESDGLAERFARGGMVVARITREEVLEVYAVREMLDGLSARLAALGILPTELDRIVWLNDRLRIAAERCDVKAMSQLNIEFHEAICAASRNSLLQQFMGQIHVWVRRFEDTTMSFPGRGLEAVAEHAMLIDALRARNPEDAERIAREHMSRARQIRIDMTLAAVSDADDDPHRRTRDLHPVVSAI
jgi:DNA-binding GntR family transcriptional regulator